MEKKSLESHTHRNHFHLRTAPAWAADSGSSEDNFKRWHHFMFTLFLHSSQGIYDSTQQQTGY